MARTAAMALTAAMGQTGAMESAGQPVCGGHQGLVESKASEANRAPPASNPWRKTAELSSQAPPGSGSPIGTQCARQLEPAVIRGRPPLGLRPVLQRAAHFVRTRRYPSMTALLAALETAAG